MSDTDWGFISNGGTFEGLLSTIVFFEDAKATLFGRPGRDGGQDVRSEDRLTVFQAKHHSDGSSSKVTADAEAEAENAEEYLKPSLSRHPQWGGVNER